MSVRLTKIAKRAGCAAKHPPGYLFPLLGRLPPVTDPNVLVGSSTADDAAVYKLDDERALVLTTDFFTPIVDDPYDFGAIAATNALSDVYAMGGRPISALNIVGFPDETLGVEVLAEILRGGAEKAREAGIDIVGGHTIKTDEPIYGLSVTGMVHPDRIASNAGGRPGDVLVLTKPLGLGIVTTAAKQDRDSKNAIVEAIRLMSTLNRGAAEAMATVEVHACTDITGFGLLGHLRNIARASGCVASVQLAKVPVIEAAWGYVRDEIAPGGTRRPPGDCSSPLRPGRPSSCSQSSPRDTRPARSSSGRSRQARPAGCGSARADRAQERSPGLLLDGAREERAARRRLSPELGEQIWLALRAREEPRQRGGVPDREEPGVPRAERGDGRGNARRDDRRSGDDGLAEDVRPAFHDAGEHEEPRARDERSRSRRSDLAEPEVARVRALLGLRGDAVRLVERAACVQDP